MLARTMILRSHNPGPVCELARGVCVVMSGAPLCKLPFEDDPGRGRFVVLPTVYGFVSMTLENGAKTF